MSEPEASIRNISDTARWAAVYRAQESERVDALFRDPFARRLAGDRGREIVQSLGPENQNGRLRAGRDEWPWVTRTFLFDQLIGQEVARGADLVLNLAAGLDARPYRMDLPSSLTWVEVDLPELLAYKEALLKDEKPACDVRRVALDLSSVNERRALFDRLGRKAGRVVILAEGLLIYMAPEEVALLARDLAKAPHFRRWILSLESPALLRLLQRQVGDQLNQASAPLKFAPKEGPGLFESYGWKPLEVHSLLKTAARVKRLSSFLRVLAMLPESLDRRAPRPWSSVCLLEGMQP